MESASIGRRTGAALLDIALFYAIHTGTLLIVAGHLPAGRVMATLSLLAMSATLLVLYGVPEIMTGATVGKRLLGLRVRFETGTEAPHRVLAVRWLLKMLPAVGFFGVAYAIAFDAGGVGDHGAVALAAICSAAGVLLLVALTDFLFALGLSRQAFRDRVVGTAVGYRGKQ